MDRPLPDSALSCPYRGAHIKRWCGDVVAVLQMTKRLRRGFYFSRYVYFKVSWDKPLDLVVSFLHFLFKKSREL